jgi:hypothetical protein
MGKKWADIIPAGLKGIGRFLDESERHGLAEMPVRLLAVVDDPGNKYGARWVVSLAYLDTGEKVAMGLKKNAYRDMQMAAAAATLKAGDEISLLTVTQDPEHNDAYVFADADPELVSAVCTMTGESLETLLAIEPWSADDEAEAELEAEAEVPAPAPEPIKGETLARAQARRG